MLGACAPVRCVKVNKIVTWCVSHSRNIDSQFEHYDYLKEHKAAGKNGVVAVLKAVIKERTK